MNTTQFLELLFDYEEKVCFSDDVYGTRLSPRMHWYGQFFSINPMIDKRADANVTSLRNFLIEFDDLSPEAQLKALQFVPYSSLVWSGGKSYHAIISLYEPVATRAEYVDIVQRLQAKLPDMDKATSNPSRFSRLPGAIRDNGNEQKLMELKSRVSMEVLNEFLGPVEPNQSYEAPQAIPGYIPPWTRSYLRLGAEPGQRNRELFKAACDLARSGLGAEDIFTMCEPVADLDPREMKITIASACKTVRGQK
jgi:hypothetical protein